MAPKGKDHITLLLTHMTYLGLDIHTGSGHMCKQGFILFYFYLKGITGNSCFACYAIASLRMMYAHHLKNA